MSHFEDFTAKNGPGSNCRRATDKSIQTYQDKLPAALIELWQEEGWCSYADGLIWIVDPSEFEDILKDWLEPSNDAVAFGRTAFADIFLWLNGEVQYLHVHYGKIATLTNNIELFLNSSLTADSYLDTVVNRKLFRKVVKRLGPPAVDECYAFVPALALGGPGTPETVEKVKLREHLGILAQLVG
jgi:hypothetical protein